MSPALHSLFPLQVPTLHLLKLQEQGKALVYDDVSTSTIYTLPLVRVLKVRPGSNDTSLELVHLPAICDEDDEGDDHDEAKQKADNKKFWSAKRGERGTTFLLTINLESHSDRDTLLTGFVMMVRKAREPYQSGSRLLRMWLLRQYLKVWKSAFVDMMEEDSEDAFILGDEKEAQGHESDESSEMMEVDLTLTPPLPPLPPHATVAAHKRKETAMQVLGDEEADEIDNLTDSSEDDHDMKEWLSSEAEDKNVRK